MTNDKYLKLRVLKPIGYHKPGAVVTIKCDALGLPYDRGWRRRLQDAKRDGCCEWVPTPKPKLKLRQNKSIKSE